MQYWFEFKAINKLNPNIGLSAIEINPEAAKKASALNIAEIETGTVIDKLSFELVDMTFTAGVLIHINPNYLAQVYDNLVSTHDVTSWYQNILIHFQPVLYIGEIKINYLSEISQVS